MIKYEAITVDGTVLYCDGCGKRGPQAAYDNTDDCLETSRRQGWTQDEENGDRDLCKECTANPPPVRAKAKARRG